LAQIDDTHRVTPEGISGGGERALRQRRSAVSVARARRATRALTADLPPLPAR